MQRVAGRFARLDDFWLVADSFGTVKLRVQDVGVVLFNIEGYFNSLIQWIKDAVSAGFIKPSNADICSYIFLSCLMRCQGQVALFLDQFADG